MIKVTVKERQVSTMADDLLEKEKEFHRVNKELQEKTKNIIEEVDSVINSQKDVRSLMTIEKSQPRLASALDNFHAEPPLHLDFGQRESGPGPLQDPDDILSPKHAQKNSDAVVRLLKTKIRMLHKEFEKYKDEYKKKSHDCTELESENVKIREAKNKYLAQISLQKNNISKLEENFTKLQGDLQSSNRENISLKKELDLLNKEIKAMNQQTSNIDLRLNRSLEENEKWKNTVKFCKIEEKELREKIRKLQDDDKLVIKNLEKQKSELLQAFKKQMILVDNLKKQKVIVLLFFL